MALSVLYRRSSLDLLAILVLFLPKTTQSHIDFLTKLAWFDCASLIAHTKKGKSSALLAFLSQIELTKIQFIMPTPQGSSYYGWDVAQSAWILTHTRADCAMPWPQPPCTWLNAISYSTVQLAAMWQIYIEHRRDGNHMKRAVSPESFFSKSTSQKYRKTNVKQTG